MATKPNETRDLALVDKLLFADTNLTLKRFSKAETRAGRTPDYRMLLASELVGFCEVKSPRDDGLDEQLEGADAFELRGGARDDPTFNRIGRHIEKAATQFDAVNPNHALPNVLVFVNNADASNFHDLLETLSGEFHAASGERFPTMKKISEGRLKKVRDRIDLFIWIDRKTNRIQGWLFNRASPDKVTALCVMFGLNEAEIME
jgi:hypothetical protein